MYTTEPKIKDKIDIGANVEMIVSIIILECFGDWMSKSIVVTKTEYKKGQEAFENLRPGYVVITSDDAEQCLADTITRVGAKAVIVGPNTYKKQLYEALSPDGIIARFGVGTDGINFESISQKPLEYAKVENRVFQFF